MEAFKPAKLYDAGGKLSERWFVFYYYLDPETGKYRRFKEYVSEKILTASGRRDRGHDLVKTINRKLRQGWNPFAVQERKYTTLMAAVDAMLAIKKETTRKRTYGTYKSLVKKFKLWAQKNNHHLKPVDHFSRHMAMEYLDYLKTNDKITNRTRNYRKMHLRTIFEMLVEREWILINPFDKIPKLPEEETEIVCFENWELQVLQKYLPEWNYDLYVCACLIFYCFIRPQEIMRLRVRHLDLRRRQITVPGSLSKTKKSEVVDIPDPLMPILHRMDLKHPGNLFLFTRHLGRGEREAAPTRMAGYWRDFADQHGIVKNIYHLKHTGAGMAVEAGINLRDLQLQLRHSSLDMTQRYLDRFKRRPSEKLAASFPDLSKLANNNGHGRFPLPESIYTPGLS